jgi:uridine kinase
MPITPTYTKGGFFLKSICISGYSGSGKTTVAKLVAANFPKSDVFDADYFMYTSTRHYPKEFKRIFRENLDWDNYANCFRNISSVGTLSQNAEYFDLIMPFVDSKIDEISIYKKSRGCEFFVVEWAFLPKLESWKKADYRVIVDAPKALRYKMLHERLCSYEKFKDDAYSVGAMRDALLTEVIENANRNYTIINNYDERIVSNVEQLADSLKQMQ